MLKYNEAIAETLEIISISGELVNFMVIKSISLTNFIIFVAKFILNNA